MADTSSSTISWTAVLRGTALLTNTKKVFGHITCTIQYCGSQIPHTRRQGKSVGIKIIWLALQSSRKTWLMPILREKYEVPCYRSRQHRLSPRQESRCTWA